MALGDTVARARETMGADAGAVEVQDFPIDRARILSMIGLNPQDPKAQAVVAVAERYKLDPVLGHIAIITNSRTPYITRDGFLHIAHRSGHLDGIEIVDGPRREGGEWTARVAVYRDDMGHAFTYPGRAPTGTDNGPELCIARAERRALRRAFAVTLPAVFGDEDGIEQNTPPAAPSAPQADEPRASDGDVFGPRGFYGPQGEDPADTRAVVEAHLPGDEPPPEYVRPISRGQQIAMLAAFRGLGINDRAERLRVTNVIISPREVSTSSELSHDEAKLVLDTLNEDLRAMDEHDAQTHTDERGKGDG
jgi:hypothetical protein